MASSREDLQQAIADIEEEWNEKAAAPEPIQVGLEQRGISVDELRLVWLAVG